MNPRLLVPRASGFNPKSIAGLAAWYDATVASSVTLASGFVSQWDDLSGGGLHLSQATEADRPSLGTLGGKTAIDFDGSNDFLRNAQAPASWLFGTYFIAFSQDTATNVGQTLITLNVAGQTYRMGLVWSALQEFRTQQISGTGSVSNVSGGSGVTNTPRLITHTYDGTSSGSLRLSGTSLTGSSSVTASSDSGVIVGIRRASNVSSLPMDGKVGELVIYNRVLSATEIARIERYLAAKWGATLA
jgi:hypothetical protein